jgi:hypothetical protein
MGLGGIPEFLDERVTFERVLHDSALDTRAATVDQSHLTQSIVVRRVDVLLDHRAHIARRKGVKVEGAFDGDAMRHRVST